MTTESDSLPPSSVEHGLTVLAQFEGERVVLGPSDIERLTGIPAPSAEGCLARLARLGYLTGELDGRYWLTGGSVGIHVRRSGGSPTSAAA
ncbi:MAG: helix-turn-helix domain-containing protein [Solirubrobacteraceae bacterium]